MEFDYIVVGAGAAGCVVAGRLAQDPRVSVLLIEYGGGDGNPLIHVPKGFYYTLRGDRYLYRYPTRPGRPGQQAEAWLRGRVLGGSAAVNGMMWARGAPADWDGLRARGNPGWGWADIGPAYQELEATLGVSVTETDDQVTRAILASATAFGWEHVTDFNASDSSRIAFTPSTIAHGRRTTSYRAFVRPALRPPGRRANLTVATRTRAGYLLFDPPGGAGGAGSRVTGVRVASRRRAADITARREVVICAGAIETPLLLERSGIGRPDILTSLGIGVRAEAPHVGERVIEQRGVALQVRLTRDIGPGARARTLRGQAGQAVQYLRNGTGVLSTAGYDLVCQFTSAPGLPRPDIHGLFAPLAVDTGHSELRLARHAGILFLGYQIRPGTYSSIHCGGGKPEDLPVIDARFLESDADRAATGPVLEIARTVLGSGPVAELVGEEEFPGPAVATPQDVVRYALDAGSGIYHAVGSAAMGPREDDVVDAALRVRGVQGLRVADASVLPGQVSGNTAAPAMVIGWRAADLIRESG
jgi:choline dehydrogenase-like flavoprotein